MSLVQSRNEISVHDEARVRITDDLLRLERGSDELLLANGSDVRPLYIRTGRRYVSNLLRVADQLGRYDRIAAHFPQDLPLLDTLLGHGILLSVEGRETDSTSRCASARLMGPRKDAMSLYLLVSQSCNMRCAYCLDGARTYRTEERLRMSEAVAFTSVERCLQQLTPGGWLEIVFFGGEPLLNWALAKAVIAHCDQAVKRQYRNRTVTYHVTSNLSFLPPDLIEWATKFGITFLCDVDGPAAVHDVCRPFKDGRPSYDTIARNVTELAAAGVHVALRATITAANQDHLLETTRLHKTLGGRSSAFVPVNTVNSDGDMLPEPLLPSPERVMEGMADVYHSRVWEEEALYPFCLYPPRLQPGAKTALGCGAPCGTMVVVDVKGDVYPCHYLVGVRRFHQGNVTDSSYPDQTALLRMCDDLHVDHLDDCKGCPWRYVCGGGCPLGRLAIVDNPMATDTERTYWKRMNCDYTKRIMELVLWRRAEETASQLLDSQRSPDAVAAAASTIC